jgi:hypothetical protein
MRSQAAAAPRSMVSSRVTNWRVRRRVIHPSFVVGRGGAQVGETDNRVEAYCGRTYPG